LSVDFGAPAGGKAVLFAGGAVSFAFFLWLFDGNIVSLQGY
jgi:hypothetical protein